MLKGENMGTILKNAITSYMEQNGLNQAEFCRLCKISTSVLKKILSGSCNLRIKGLFKVGRHLGIPMSKLLADW